MASSKPCLEVELISVTRATVTADLLLDPTCALPEQTLPRFDGFHYGSSRSCGQGVVQAIQIGPSTQAFEDGPCLGGNRRDIRMLGAEEERHVQAGACQVEVLAHLPEARERIGKARRRLVVPLLQGRHDGPCPGPDGFREAIAIW